MKKQDILREIIQQLLEKGKIQFTKDEIDLAIVRTRLVADQRSIDKWFALLWRLEYFIQPEYQIYQLNFDRIQELEVKLPMQVDPKQRKLCDVKNNEIQNV